MNLILPAIACLALAGCAADRGKCLEDRMAFIMVPQIVTTKPLIMMQRVQAVTVCSRWEFPEGKAAE